MGIIHNEKLPVTYVQARLKKDDTKFIIKKDWQIVDEWGMFGWDLYKVEYQEPNKEKNIYAWLKLWFLDKEKEIYCVNMWLSTTTVMFLSSLSRLAKEWHDFKGIRISLSTYKDYPSIWLFADNYDWIVKWNHDIKDISILTEVVKDANWNDILDNNQNKIFIKTKLVEKAKEIIESINEECKYNWDEIWANDKDEEEAIVENKESKKTEEDGERTIEEILWEEKKPAAKKEKANPSIKDDEEDDEGLPF